MVFLGLVRSWGQGTAVAGAGWGPGLCFTVVTSLISNVSWPHLPGSVCHTVGTLGHPPSLTAFRGCCRATFLQWKNPTSANFAPYSSAAQTSHRFRERHFKKIENKSFQTPFQQLLFCINNCHIYYLYSQLWNLSFTHLPQPWFSTKPKPRCVSQHAVSLWGEAAVPSCCMPVFP